MIGSSKCYHARTATMTHARMLRRTAALALLVLPWDLAAQVGSELMDDQPTEESMAVIGPVPLVSLFPAFGAGAQGPPTLSEIGWLSAAIEELRLSPFHATESALHLGTSAPIGIGAPNGLRIPMEAYSPGSIQSARGDSTLSRGRVFLTSWVFAATSDFAAFYLSLGGYSTWLAFPTPILGTAFGATLGGARFGPALAGSTVSLGVVLGMLATGLVVDPDDNFLAFIVIPATIQAGITTWIASAFD
jgi:hypothetical protein